MNDIVERLRNDQPVTQDTRDTQQCELQDEAADEIERLRGLLVRAGDIAEAIDSGRGNEKEIARSIRELSQ